VRLVENFLRRRLGLTDDRLLKLTASDLGIDRPSEPPDQWPTYENMVRSFRWLTETAKQGDLVYIHYSGHGGRTDTIVPQLKGPKGLDEALVPTDIGNSSARYLRDVELAKLLREMADKGLVVTAVLDCCHSGGATRGPLRRDPAPREGDIAIRGVSFIDHTERPMDSLVGSPEDVAAGWGKATGALRSAAARGFISPPEVPGCVVLAACRPSEAAYEYPFDGRERNGALTYWLLQALQDLSPDLTYRTVHDRVLARVHSQFTRQTPMLFGDADRVVFGNFSIEPEFATRVLSVNPPTKTVTLQAGQAGLVREGAEFVIYPAGIRDLGDISAWTARVRVSEPGATTSVADVIETFGAEAVRPGDRAVLVGAASLKLVRKVRLEQPDGSPPPAGDAAFTRVRQALPGKGWVELTEDPTVAADFVVTTTIDRNGYRLCDGAGEPIPLRPELATADKDAAAAVAARLVHLAKYRAVRELDNTNPCSSLRGKLVVRLLGAQADYDPDERPDPVVFPEGESPTIRPGEWTFLSIENRSAQVLNIVLLNLQANWAISQAHAEEFLPIDPNAEPLVIPLRASLPPGYDRGTDTLKIIATVDPPYLRALELPPLDRSILPRTKGRTGGALAGLLEAITDDTPTRALTPAAFPSRGWAIAQLEVQVRL
jgi:hypothetical protein